MNDVLPVSGEVQTSIDAHIRDVDQSLQQSGVGQSERQSICEQLQSQIFEMLSERCTHEPQVADVRSLLAELESPADWAESGRRNQPAKAPSASARISRLAIVSATIGVFGIAGAFGYSVLRGNESGRQEAAIICFLITLLAMAMGFTAIKEMRREPKVIKGYLLAYIGIICLPITFCLWANREIAYPINTRLNKEVNAYRMSREVRVMKTNGDIVSVQRDMPIQKPVIEAGETILSVPDPTKSAKTPFVSGITTKQGAYLFSLTTCFGPTFLLALLFVPLTYRRLHPDRQRGGPSTAGPME